MRDGKKKRGRGEKKRSVMKDHVFRMFVEVVGHVGAEHLHVVELRAAVIVAARGARGEIVENIKSVKNQTRKEVKTMNQGRKKRMGKTESVGRLRV